MVPDGGWYMLKRAAALGSLVVRRVRGFDRWDAAGTRR
jgi:hypothetical protein